MEAVLVYLQSLALGRVVVVRALLLWAVVPRERRKHCSAECETRRCS